MVAIKWLNVGQLNTSIYNNKEGNIIKKNIPNKLG